MSVCFEFLVPVRDFKPSALKALVKRILKEESRPGCDLTVIFTDSAHLRRLNRRYRGQDRATDVISFALLEGPKACWTRPNLGDVYISLPRARRQAKEYRATVEEEIRRLTVHGVLHLLGYDHSRLGPARKMQRREEFYLYGH
ncbi:rRNA maturation RNase YbeY [candidate division TA06 bacterium]|uniref:Endoribonuclease YbeY n=1 Tax=candidate division TA06 bacterium TaxID=2250710 RepID=A0A933IA54_UNCT6|nr:rRNA maturation RNase YbeY [candidate division TA06 bacterium]